MKLKDVFWVLFISILPLIELRGAIPVGTVLGLPFYLNFILAVVGNLLPIPFILLFIPYVLDFMEKIKFLRPVVKWIRAKAMKNRGKIVDTAESSEEGVAVVCEESSVEATAKMGKAAFLGLMLFVLIPLPGTGAWTGALVAALFNFPKLKSFAAITLGVLGCGVIMCLASYGVLGFLSFLL